MASVYFLGRAPANREINLRNSDSFCCSKCCAQLKRGKLQCYCGEKQNAYYTWRWNDMWEPNNTTIFTNDNTEVHFHPLFSSGTSAVRGTDILKKNYHYYFEVKILTYLFGTDIMVGVGCPQIDVRKYNGKYCSMLGSDDKSWGYSYKGFIQHYGLKRKYGKPFGLGSLIGVYIDMCKGTLEFYLNRKPLGVAFTGLKDFELYPMACSTATQTSIRLCSSMIYETSLQMLCLKSIKSNPISCKLYKNIPGLSKMFENDLFWIIPPKKLKANSMELEDEAVISNAILKRKHVSVFEDSCSCKKFITNVSSQQNVLDQQNSLEQNVPDGQNIFNGENSSRVRKLDETWKKKNVGDNKRKRTCLNCNDITCLCKNKLCKFQPDKNHVYDAWFAPNSSSKKSKDDSLDATYDDDDDEEIDLYSDLPLVKSEERFCAKCSFKLGTHIECLFDDLCSFCDEIM